MMIENFAARRPGGNSDFRGRWQNSPELRNEVRILLQEWADAVRGGFPPLGYPTKTPFAISPQKSTPNFDMDRVQEVSDTMMMWHLIQRYIGDFEMKAKMIRLFEIIRVEFICSGVPQEVKAKKFKITRVHYSRLLGEAMYRFWVLHQ